MQPERKTSELVATTNPRVHARPVPFTARWTDPCRYRPVGQVVNRISVTLRTLLNILVALQIILTAVLCYAYIVYVFKDNEKYCDFDITSKCLITIKH